MTDRAEDIALLMAATEDAMKDIPESPQAEEPEKFTILQSWNEVLTNIESSAAEKIGPALAVRVCNSYPMLTFKDITEYYKRYHDKLIDLRAVLLAEIETDEKCFEHISDDAEHNRHHYLNLLTGWRRVVSMWELEWNVGDDDAAVEFAALADAATFFIGEQGLAAHLNEIEFQFTPEDAEEVLAASQAE